MLGKKFGVAVCAMTLILSLAAGAHAKQVVKYIQASPLTAQETASEGKAVSVYLGSLEYLMKEHSKLKGKYSLKFVHSIFTSPNDCLSAIASGGGELTYTAPQFLEQYDPAWKLITAPGLFQNFDHFLRAMDTPAWQARADELAKKNGVTIIKWMASIGDFYLFTSKGPIKTMDDLKGQKIRYNGAQGYATALKKFGVTGIALPYTEVVSSLQTNMIDGLLSEIFAQDYYDLPRYTKYLVPVSWGIAPMAIAANTQWWESLPEAERNIFKQAFEIPNAHAYFEKLQKVDVERWGKNSKTELVELSAEEQEKWRKTLADSTKEFSKDLDPALMQAIVDTEK